MDTSRRSSYDSSCQWLNYSARGGGSLQARGQKAEARGRRAESKGGVPDQGFSSIQGTQFGFYGIQIVFDCLLYTSDAADE